jgi:hypothetical protein
MTRPEKSTDASLPRLATENMLPASAASVMPIILMAHSSGAFVARPNSSLKIAGAKIKANALNPKTIDPARNTSRARFAFDELFTGAFLKHWLYARL